MDLKPYSVEPLHAHWVEGHWTMLTLYKVMVMTQSYHGAKWSWKTINGCGRLVMVVNDQSWPCVWTMIMEEDLSRGHGVVVLEGKTCYGWRLAWWLSHACGTSSVSHGRLGTSPTFSWYVGSLTSGYQHNRLHPWQLGHQPLCQCAWFVPCTWWKQGWSWEVEDLPTIARRLC